MYNFNDFNRLNLSLTHGKITSVFDKVTGETQKSFHQRLTQPNVAKLYIIKKNGDYLYVGTTMQSLTTRIRYGLKADGKTGYHGYKWKYKKKVELYVWCFDGLKKIQIESIEAEVVFLIRKKTGHWPATQNEIHFNNEFVGSKIFAEKIFKRIE